MKKMGLVLISSLFCFQAFADSSISSLSRRDPLRLAGEDVSVEWADGNITTGTTDLEVGKILNLPTLDADLKAISHEELRLKLEDFSTDLPADVKNEVRAYTAAVESEIVAALGQSNDYSPRNDEGFAVFKEQLQAVVKLLGTSTDLKVISSKVVFPANIDEGTLDRTVSNYLIVNTTTNKVAHIFLIQGFM